MNNKEIKLNATTQASYYGKAGYTEIGGVFSLRSYDTIVCEYDSNTGEFSRLWGGYSRTTANHINDFRRLFNLPALNKKAWESLPVKGGNEERYKVEFSNGFVNWVAGAIFDSYEDAEAFGESVSAARNYSVGYAVCEC